jgi:hypothetical protein
LFACIITIDEIYIRAFGRLRYSFRASGRVEE